jgi:beta-galactosidase
VAEGIPRRWVLRGGALAGAGVAAGVAGAVAGSAGVSDTVVGYSSGFNAGWLFGGVYTDGSSDPGFDDGGFEPVTLPHTVVPLSWTGWDYPAWQNVWIYRKHFSGAGLTRGRVLVTFDAIMTNATAVLNGTVIGSHTGGYLPFECELTSALKPGDNVLAVIVDSRWLDVPPAAPPEGTGSIDYVQPGGIYRDATLRVLPDAFISDVFASPSYVLDPVRRQVTTRVTLSDPVSGTLSLSLNDEAGSLATATGPVSVDSPRLSVTLSGLSDVHLWSPETPRLYSLVVTLSSAGGTHTVTKRIGFRSAEFRADGFYLNGSRRIVFGLNRHQLFPYLGMAAPARLQRRDAQILREELNCTMVRCSHYPQSPHFLDACDELGLMVFQEAPGWHWVGDATFQDIVQQNVRDMVIRDRSRPSVVLWGTRLNESVNRPGLYQVTRRIADSLDGSRPSTGTMTTQSTAGWAEDVFSYDDYAASAGVPVVLPPVAGVPYLVSEAVGAMRPRYLWTSPPSDLAQQALAHAVVHDAVASRPGFAGALCWCAVDYYSASFNDKNWNTIRSPGVLDVFRVPKPAAAIYRSQVSPSVRPVIAPAFFWPSDGGMVATNCSRLSVYLGGRLVGDVYPDSSRFPGLEYPPAFVSLPSSSGDELVLEGYVGTRVATTLRMSAARSADRLALSAPDRSITADGSDGTLVTFQAVDAYGNHRVGVTGSVELSCDGPAVLVAPNPFPFAETGGVGGAFVRSVAGQPGQITIKAVHPTLGTASLPLTATPA